MMRKLNDGRKKIRRLFLSVLLAAAFTAGLSEQGLQGSGMLAWWGTLYPKFCFGEILNQEEDCGGGFPKISFYLAKLLDW